jgi:hypothetical protein
VTFALLLHYLIGLTGRHLTVTAGANGVGALACSGVMSGAIDMLDADAGEGEVLYLPIVRFMSGSPVRVAIPIQDTGEGGLLPAVA